MAARRHALQLPKFSTFDSFGNSIEAHRSVVTSIMCFVDSPDSYEEAVARAIGQGNDVDTLAAMTGAISGARLGVEAIPKHLIDSLEDGVQGRSYLFNLRGLCLRNMILHHFKFFGCGSSGSYVCRRGIRCLTEPRWKRYSNRMECLMFGAGAWCLVLERLIPFLLALALFKWLQS